MKALRTKTKDKQKSIEFWIYFTIIFVLALPVSCIRYLMQIADHGPRKEAVKSPFSQAWSRAWSNTPQIFQI